MRVFCRDMKFIGFLSIPHTCKRTHPSLSLVELVYKLTGFRAIITDSRQMPLNRSASILAKRLPVRSNCFKAANRENVFESIELISLYPRSNCSSWLGLIAAKLLANSSRIWFCLKLIKVKLWKAGSCASLIWFDSRLRTLSVAKTGAVAAIESISFILLLAKSKVSNLVRGESALTGIESSELWLRSRCSNELEKGLSTCQSRSWSWLLLRLRVLRLVRPLKDVVDRWLIWFEPVINRI